MTYPHGAAKPPAKDAPGTGAHEECGNCLHYPAYHDGDGGRPCRGWNPEKPDFFCDCKGWKTADVKT